MCLHFFENRDGVLTAPSGTGEVAYPQVSMMEEEQVGGILSKLQQGSKTCFSSKPGESRSYERYVFSLSTPHLMYWE